jgi:starch synthase
MSLRVLAVASELFPLVKTGGLADAAGALPGALAPEGVAVTSLIPSPWWDRFLPSTLCVIKIWYGASYGGLFNSSGRVMSSMIVSDARALCLA